MNIFYNYPILFYHKTKDDANKKRHFPKEMPFDNLMFCLGSFCSFHSFFEVSGSLPNTVGIGVLAHLDGALDDECHYYNVDGESCNSKDSLSSRISGDAHVSNDLSRLLGLAHAALVELDGRCIEIVCSDAVSYSSAVNGRM